MGFCYFHRQIVTSESMAPYVRLYQRGNCPPVINIPHTQRREALSRLQFVLLKTLATPAGSADYGNCPEELYFYLRQMKKRQTEHELKNLPLGSNENSIILETNSSQILSLLPALPLNSSEQLSGGHGNSREGL